MSKSIFHINFHYLGIHVQYLHVNEKKKTKICRDVNYFETFTVTN